MRNSVKVKDLAGVQYLGLGGISRACIEAVVKLIHFGDRINEAKLLSHGGTHCFLLNINYDERVAIKSGFSSGYSGQGPRTLSDAIQILDRHGVEIDEYEVSKELIDRLDASALTRHDLEFLEETRPVRPTSLYDYVLDDELEDQKLNARLQRYFPKSMLFGLVDPRLVDLAMEFEEQPDKAIMSGYRRLEDIVRKRTESKGEHSSKLFSSAFQKDKGVLHWGEIDPSEHIGRVNLFTGAYMAFRNRRAHQEPDPYAGGDLQEFLLLNHLFVLEREAQKREVEEPTEV